MFAERGTTRMKKILPYALTLSLVGQSYAFASGLEKSVLWSGRNAGVAGAVTSSVGGPEALYFNPAGLGGTTGLAASINFSPTFSKFQAPIAALGQTLPTTSSNTNFSPPAAALVSYGLTPQLGIGVGYYAAGGSKVVFDGIALAPVLPSAQLKSDIGLTEFSVGGGYEVLDGLRIGLAWRALFVKADLAFQGSPVGAATATAYSTFTGASATRYNGFRVGLQYAPRDSRWGIGANWRSAIDFVANNVNATAQLLTLPTSPPTTSATALAPYNGSTTTAAIGATLPQQLSIGGYFDIFEKTWRVLAQYDFTEYHRLNQLFVSGSLTLPTPVGVTPLSSVTLNWKNQSNIRLGTEYKLLENVVLRGGYVFTSQVTANDIPLSTFAAPGPAHSVFLGAGSTIIPNLSIDGALELTWISATVASTDAPAGGSVAAGNYKDMAYAAHVGVTYAFGTF